MPTPPDYRNVIKGRMITVTDRLNEETREKYLEVTIYPGPEMIGKPEYEVVYPYVLADMKDEVARMASGEFPPGGVI